MNLYFGMHPDEIAKIIDCNERRRSNLLEKANDFESSTEKAQFIVDYFTNKLPKETIAEIDEVPRDSVSNFSYDYSFVKGSESFNARTQKSKKWCRAITYTSK